MHLSTKLYRIRLIVVASLFYVLLICVYFIVGILWMPTYNETGEYLKYNIRTKTYNEKVKIKTIEQGYRLNGKAFRRFYFYTATNGVCYIDTENVDLELIEGMLIDSTVTDISLLYNDNEVIDRYIEYITYFNAADETEGTVIKQQMLKTVQERVKAANSEYTLVEIQKLLLVGFIVTLLYLFIQGIRIRRLTKRYEELRVLSVLEEEK